MSRYQILYNGNSIYDPASAQLQVIDPVLTLEMSAAGSLEMTVPPSNSYAGQVNEAGEIRVVDTAKNVPIWAGRVTECEVDLYGSKRIYAEGALAWLQDTLILDDDTTYTGTISSLLIQLVRKHNAAVQPNRKYNTAVTVSGFDSSSYERTGDDSSTLDTIKKWLIDPLGGYIYLTYAGKYTRPQINYVKTLTHQCTQTIELGKNLLDYTRKTSTADIITAVIPRGKDGLTADTVYSVSANVYGDRYKILTWDDVEDTDELQDLAEEYLSSGQWAEAELTVEAADLHDIQDVDPIKLGDLVHVTSSYHGIDTWLPVMSMEIHLDSASQSYTLGSPLRQELTSYNRETKEELTQDIAEAAASGGGGGGGGSGFDVYVIPASEYDETQQRLDTSHDVVIVVEG